MPAILSRLDGNGLDEGTELSVPQVSGQSASNAWVVNFNNGNCNNNHVDINNNYVRAVR